MSKEVRQSVAESTAVESGAFMGRHDYALDPKKRLTIPSEWRGALGQTVYVIPDRKEKCLNLFPKVEMDIYLNQLREMALLDPKLHKVCAAIGAVSQQLTLDVQGRARIADRLLQFANLSGTVAMVGSVRMIKLYNPELLGPEDAIDIDAFDAIMSEAGM